jgi:hypothetical protein
MRAFFIVTESVAAVGVAAAASPPHPEVQRRHPGSTGARDANEHRSIASPQCELVVIVASESDSRSTANGMSFYSLTI